MSYFEFLSQVKGIINGQILAHFKVCHNGSTNPQPTFDFRPWRDLRCWSFPADMRFTRTAFPAGSWIVQRAAHFAIKNWTRATWPRMKHDETAVQTSAQCMELLTLILTHGSWTVLAHPAMLQVESWNSKLKSLSLSRQRMRLFNQQACFAVAMEISHFCSTLSNQSFTSLVRV